MCIIMTYKINFNMVSVPLRGLHFSNGKATFFKPVSIGKFPSPCGDCISQIVTERWRKRPSYCFRPLAGTAFLKSSAFLFARHSAPLSFRPLAGTAFLKFIAPAAVPRSAANCFRPLAGTAFLKLTFRRHVWPLGNQSFRPLAGTAFLKY